MAGFDINQLFGLSAAKIFSALLVAMLTKAPGNINSDAGIKRVIRAKDYVDLPIHGASHDRSENGTDGSGQPHSQCAPKGDTESAFHDACSAAIGRQHAQHC